MRRSPPRSSPSAPFRNFSGSRGDRHGACLQHFGQKACGLLERPLHKPCTAPARGFRTRAPPVPTGRAPPRSRLPALNESRQAVPKRARRTPTRPCAFAAREFRPQVSGALPGPSDDARRPPAHPATTESAAGEPPSPRVNPASHRRCSHRYTVSVVRISRIACHGAEIPVRTHVLTALRVTLHDANGSAPTTPTRGALLSKGHFATPTPKGPNRAAARPRVAPAEHRIRRGRSRGAADGTAADTARRRRHRSAPIVRPAPPFTVHRFGAHPHTRPAPAPPGCSPAHPARSCTTRVPPRIRPVPPPATPAHPEHRRHPSPFTERHRRDPTPES